MTTKETIFRRGWMSALSLAVLLAIGYAALRFMNTALKPDDGPVRASASSVGPGMQVNVSGQYARIAQPAESGDAGESGPSTPLGDNGSTQPSKAGTQAKATPEEGSRRSAPARPPSWILADELLAGLSNLNLTLGEGPLTVEDVQEIRQSLEQLSALGDAAIPAIRDFLRRGGDLTLNERIDAETLRATGPLDHATLRLALFDVLHRVGGPAAESAMYDAFRGTRVPTELGALTDYLEAESPGYYREEALDIARKVLDSAWNGQLEGQDVGPLFHILETYGDAEVVAELEENLDQRWGQYAAIALGGVTEGAGIPVLSALVEDADLLNSRKSLYTDTGKLALQTLAGVAGEDFGASNTLVEKAQANEIPADMWPVLASVLTGDDQLQIKKPEIDLSMAETYSTSKAYKYPYNTHRVGPYVIYSVHGSAQLSEEEAATRLDLISRLLTVTDDPAAKKALERAQNLLAGNGS